MVLLIGRIDDVLHGGGIKGENNQKETAIYAALVPFIVSL